MSTDIHFVVEEISEHSSNHWVGIYTSETPGYRIYKEDHPLAFLSERKNYNFFATLCGVRSKDAGIGTRKKPNGRPDRMSDLTRIRLMQWGNDAHSIGHCSLYEFIEAYAKVSSECAKAKLSGIDIIKIYLDLLIGSENPNFFRVVYWFDN